ncbi:MAG TPA: isoprenylcysteine carboxylmethyltransferase family protein [Candidatus Baltobacteraceae bacterium]|nr:isoprenylcysteine carboxylmethyltransferase family protein [Candidatus Baltobacteraceae bacterium]
MTDPRSDELQALVFKNRGALLSIPALMLAVLGKPSAFSVTVGLPIALAGELIRCWAVGYSGVTTRDDRVTAPELVTAGPYAYVRNPLYVGNFITAAGFALAFTGGNVFGARAGLIAASLGTMAAVYGIVIPHEERYLRSQFGEPYERYCACVPQIVPAMQPPLRQVQSDTPRGEWKPDVIARAEKNTFLTFGAMLAILALKALKG